MMKWMRTDECVSNTGVAEYKQWKTSHTTRRENIQTRVASSAKVFILGPLNSSGKALSDVLVMVFHSIMASSIAPTCDFKDGGRDGGCSQPARQEHRTRGPGRRWIAV